MAMGRGQMVNSALVGADTIRMREDFTAYPCGGVGVIPMDTASRDSLNCTVQRLIWLG